MSRGIYPHSPRGRARGPRGRRTQFVGRAGAARWSQMAEPSAAGKFDITHTVMSKRERGEAGGTRPAGLFLVPSCVQVPSWPRPIRRWLCAAPREATFRGGEATLGSVRAGSDFAAESSRMSRDEAI